MAALTAARATKLRNTSGMTKTRYAVKTSAVIYPGGLVHMASGRAAAAASGTNRKCVGVADPDGPVVTGNTGGTKYVNVLSNMEAAFDPRTALTAAFVGANAMVDTDQEVTTTAVGTALVRVRVGVIREYVSATEVWIGIGRFAEGDIVASA